MPAAESQHARREQRDAYHPVEDRPVAVPADAGAGGVSDHQRLFESFGRQAGEVRCACAQGQQEAGDRRRGIDARGAEVVAPSERDGLTLPFPSLELERCERELLDVSDERGFFLRRDEIFAEGEARRARVEQSRLRARLDACHHCTRVKRK
jgi:hypothetical protein